MLRKSEFWLLTVLAILAACTAAINIVLFQNNRAAQAEVSSRQQYIQQSIQLHGLYTEMVKAIADLAVRNQDAELGNLLSSQGISVSPAPPAAAGGAGKGPQ